MPASSGSSASKSPAAPPRPKFYTGTDMRLVLIDWTSSATYRVYPQPAESPVDRAPAPPSDGRVEVVDPEDPVASPNGWFDAGVSVMDGNNVHACADRDGNNAWSKR